MLKLLLKSASNLINVDSGPSNLSDPYVKAVFRGEKKKTDHIKDNLNPVWTSQHNNELEWDLGTEPIILSDEIHIQVKDYESIKFLRKLLGQVTIPLKDLLKTKDYTIEQSYPLFDSHSRPIVATLSLKLQYIPSRQVSSYSADIVDAGEVDQDEHIDLEEEVEVVDEEGHIVRKRRKAHAHEIKREWSTRTKYFKITVKIHEGRQLPGTNISPIARVIIRNNKQDTRVKRSTNSPDFNQTFTFNFHCSEAELFDELITLEVFNSKKLFRSSLLGFFESEIGAIYEFPGHSIIRKWVHLTGSGLHDHDDDDDKHGLSKLLRRRGQDGGNAGYLKVTVTVLGSGDEPPSLKQLEAAVDDEDDVETNCLMPVSVSREPAEFHLKVYMAEDLPQMDAGFTSTFRKLFLPGRGSREDPSEKKKQVDPFFVFSFSGKKVETKTIYRQNNPTFNELLRLPILYPTMCERIKFQLFDKDRASQKDTIATSFLSLSEISGKGYSSSFLPHFGPCFVNLYGSPREFSIFSSEQFEKLNKGIGEGVAYRGRVLVELTQERSAGNSRPSTHNVHNDDIIRVQPYLRQEKYKLFACFKNAAMISKIDKPIEFEASIGNFGNTLDETAVSCNTPPSNPVYDGCHYHYLPWHHYKPCICLNCNWEDISFRIEPLNIITKLYETMELLVAEAKARVEARDEEKAHVDARDEEEAHVEAHEERVRSVRSCLQQFINKCSNAKKDLKPSKTTPPVNTLDLRLAKLRQDEFGFIVDEAMDWTHKIISQEDTDLNKVVEDMEDYVSRLKSLAFEPQISIPDVIIWMLCGGTRIAYHRVPIQDVMFSKKKDARGKDCGKTMEVLMKYPGESKRDKEYREVPAMVRVELWVGLCEDQQDWIKREGQEGSFKIFAETYENEIWTPISRWTKPHLSFRPHFSNASGDVPLDMKNYVVPKGWQFSGKEKAVLDKSLMYEGDWKLTAYTEEIYEHQSRNLLGGDWSEVSQWTEEDTGESSRSIDDFQVRLGWRWTSNSWEIDKDRAVDGDGWEYCVSEDLSGIYVNAAKANHMSRRRRWVRTRELEVQSTERNIHGKYKKQAEEDWEYAATFQSKFHVKKRKRDLVRRKRLFKEIVCDGGGQIADLPPKLAINLNAKHKKDKKSKDTHGAQDQSEDEFVERKGFLAVLPRMFVVHEKPHKFQLWVYVYQGRDLLAMDDTGQSDPYVRVAFCNQSQKTEWKLQTLTPKWDQTLVFPHVELFDTIENIVQGPPNIIMEVFDKDPVGKHDFIGRCMMQPTVHTKEGGTPPSLTWIDLHNGQANAGQVLAAAELFLDEDVQLPNLPKGQPGSSSHYIYPVRDMVRPALQMVAVEILCWGVRNMKNYSYRSVDRPSVEFEWGNPPIKSEPLQNMQKNPNFLKPDLKREIFILEKEPFTPAMSIKVYDNRSFNQKPLVGMTTISSIDMSDLQPFSETTDLEERPATPFSPAPTVFKKREIPDHKREKEKFDWWSKYYYSMRTKRSAREIKKDSKFFDMFSTEDETTKDHMDMYEEKKYGTIEIFDKELENVKQFEGLNDFVTTLKLRRGKWKGEEEDDDDIVGELKANIRVCSVEDANKDKLPPGMFNNLTETKMNWPVKCVVRVYVICAFGLQPHDPSTESADPYLIVSLGGKTRNDKNHCQHNTLEPVFGRMFEISASIPIAKDLKITVMDSDSGFDDVIGETTIDLEQRLLSRFHASCGLSKLFYVDGPFMWRDSKRPKDILRDYCHAKGYQLHFYPKGKPENQNTVVLESRTKTHGPFRVEEIENYDANLPDLGSVDQQLSLYALHRLGLVPEHVETRSLYSSLQPGIEQGKLQLWVDIFPKTGINVEIKPAVDIKPRTATPYVLRVVIWDTSEVELQDYSGISKERMSDIFVKGWIDGIDEKQKTDVHYRSLDGDGNFNWRMCFPLMIMPIEKQLVISKKEKFHHMHKTTKKVDPKLKIQIWENDTFSLNDFLGTRTLHLNDLVRPCKSPSRCGTKDDPVVRKERPRDFVDLFQGPRSIRGWYGCWKTDTPDGKLGGKVDMSIEILTEEQAKNNPAGKGRDDPNQHPYLPEPDRPKTSFLWFTSPFKSMRYIVWRNYKWYIIGFIVIVLLALILVLFIYNVPGYSVKKILGA